MPRPCACGAVPNLDAVIGDIHKWTHGYDACGTEYVCGCGVCKAKRICNTVIDGDADAYLAVLDIRAALDGGDA